MKKPSPAFKTYYSWLRSKCKYFKKKGYLKASGSFYYNDKDVADELGFSERHVKRLREFGNDNGYFVAIPGKYRGKASDYWVPLKPDSKSPFKKWVKGDKRSPKGDKKSLKGRQEVTTSNNTNNIKTNIAALPPLADLKETAINLLKLYQKKWTLDRFISMGYPRDEAEVFLENL